ncbi:uncharacterized protein [Penaeus vannamei]|uniref:uncharacterized protein n=1 Tax=Penaeus vannamei TaxID=6689 RepID=UPI00387F39D5
MLDVCATGPPSIKRRVLKILNLRNASVKTIKNIMREYASNLGEEPIQTRRLKSRTEYSTCWIISQKHVRPTNARMLGCMLMEKEEEEEEKGRREGGRGGREEGGQGHAAFSLESETSLLG